jgi:predicted DNA-binding ribbon-helix-helix protein
MKRFTKPEFALKLYCPTQAGLASVLRLSLFFRAPEGRMKMCQIFAGQDPERYQLETRRMRLNGQSTSIRLEKSFWVIIDELAGNEGLTTPAFVSKLHGEVLELYGDSRNFTALLRCTCLLYREMPQEDRDSRIAAE